MSFSSFFIIVVSQALFFAQFVYSSSLEYDGSLEIKLEHALIQDSSGGHPVFRERGNISVQSIRIGQTILNQNPLSKDDSLLLRDLALNNGFYQIRGSVNKDKFKFISTVKACMIAEAQLDDRISVSLDYAGRVVAVSHIIASKSACEGASVPEDKLQYFTTTVYVRHAEIGPTPDTASYIQRLERENEAKERGEGKDNRSFLAKYWMYIVPVVIFMFISSAANADNAAGGS
ncbi:hypothetical protein WA026_011753 [Henosepilachna vigintioctopunctata]|uniref:ER membrane protein complex subunit 10 n=1 Tax=Henosepilachna vigintioctopunctata TaxID=420089 RepID=A0AAW1UM79_9CUCU